MTSSLACCILLVAGVQAMPQNEKPQAIEAVEVYSRGKIRAEAHQHVEETDDDIRFASLAQTGDKRQLLRSEDHDQAGPLQQMPGAWSPAQELQGAMAGGVFLGSCKNFKKLGTRDVAVACPDPLKMVGCSCRDREGENTGGCGTKFSTPDTCNAFTKMGRNITAYVRCCHMDWATNFSVRTSEVSGSNDGDGVQQGCLEGENLLGCACLPGDAPNRGCKHTQVQETGCLATNLDGHTAGVKAQALCAVLPNSTNWETVMVAEHAKDASTNLSCSKPYPDLQMISCSCGSSFGNCNGGKVIANRCECFGKRCFGTARCANIPIPPRDCVWADWGEWTDCSVSCGTGQQNRIREIGLLAANGGQECDGSTNQTIKCKGDGTKRECNNTMTASVVKLEGDNTLIIVLVIVVVLTALGGGAAHHHKQKQQQELEHQNMMGGEGYGGYGGYEGEHQGSWGAQESWGQESWGEGEAQH